MPLICKYFFLILLMASAACQRSSHVSQREHAGVPEKSEKADSAADKYLSHRSERIGFAPVTLTTKEWESALGNFVADLIMSQASIYSKHPIDLSVISIESLRKPLPEGEITVGHVYEMIPAAIDLVTVKVKGHSLQNLFNLAAAKKNIAIGNVTYTITSGRPFDISIGGQPLQQERIYTVALPDYQAHGGQNMHLFKESPQPQILGLTLRDAVINHIRSLTAAGKPVRAIIEGRVQVGD